MEDKRTKDDYREFGIFVGHLGVRYSAGWECYECGWDLTKFEIEEWKQFVVGFSKKVPETPRIPIPEIPRDHIGEIVIECPQCSKRFWFHVNLIVMRNIFPE